MDKSQRYRLKDLDGYREKKREYAKTPEQREVRRLYMQKWREANRAKHNSQARESYQRYKDTPERKAARYGHHLRYRYGITPEDYERMLKSQGGVCAICAKPPGKRRLHIDHCHESEKIRGLLCTGCNTRLGWWELHRDEVDAYLS